MSNFTQVTEPIPAAAGAREANARLTRRSLLARGAVAGASLLPLAGMTSKASAASLRPEMPTQSDFAILRFLAAAELLESDLWQQYNELTLGNAPYNAALVVLDGDMPAYVTQNTTDEISHAEFLNAYLASMGQAPVDLDPFRTLPSSPATGAQQFGRLTNLTNLTVDTSWYLRYRSAGNPDLGDTFPQVINITNRTAIPLRDNYRPVEIQAIANTAGFHFAMIEQGGSSLYDAMSHRAESSQALRIVTSIGGTEVAHFQTWHDKAGNAPPLNTGDGLVFPDLNDNPATATNKIMPRPCAFLDRDLPLCSVIRPTSLRLAGARAAARFLTATGLFIAQSREFFKTLSELAEAADGISS